MPLIHDRRPAGLLAATRWNTAGVVLSGLTRLAYSALIGHLAGTAALGYVSASLFLAMLAVQAGPNAAGVAASKFMARTAGRLERARGAGDPLADDGDLQRTWRAVLVAGSALTLLCAAAAVLVSWRLVHRPPVQSLLVGLVVVSMSTYLMSRGARLGTGGFRRSVLGEVGATLTSVVLLLAALVNHASSLLLLPLVCGYGVYAVLTWPRGRGGPEGRPGARSGVDRHELRSFLGWAVVGGVSSAGLLQLSVVVAAAVDTPVRVGQYAAAIAVGTPMALLASPLSQALFAVLARSSDEAGSGETRRRVDTSTRALVIVMVAVGGGLALVARSALAVVGPDLDPAVPLLRVVVLTVIVSTVTVPAVTSLTSGHGRGMRGVALTSASGGLVGILVIASTAPRWDGWGLGAGVDGVVAGYAVGTWVTNALPWCVAWRRHHLAWRWLTAKVLLALLVLVVLFQAPWVDSTGGAWASAVCFSAGWLALSSRQIGALVGLRAPR